MRSLTSRLEVLEQEAQARQQAERERLQALWEPFWAAFTNADLKLLATHPARANLVNPDELTAEHWRVVDLWYRQLYALLRDTRPFIAGASPHTITERQRLAILHDYLAHHIDTTTTPRPVGQVAILAWIDTTMAELDPRLPVAVRAGMAAMEGATHAPESV